MADELEREQARLEKMAAEAAASAEGTGTDLVSLTQSPDQARRALAAKKVEVEKKSKALRKQQEKVKAIVERQAAIAERRMNEALAAIRPMQEMIARLEEGIWTVNLYLGTREQITQLADGEPAPAETTITVRQMVLAMDEECAVAAESGGIDARSIEEFDEWLIEDPAHRDQVFPEPKGVVALVPRMRDHRKTGDPWVDRRIREEDEQTYLLIRNGERLYRILPDFKVGKNLLPRADEFTSIFEYRDGFGRNAEVKILEPGTRRWEEAYERMEARERHFMRVALILQGLADRTTVFQPLTAAGVSFLDRQNYTDERVRFVNDAERTLGTGREPFRQWQERLMGELKVGMRIVGDFRKYYDGSGFGGEAYDSQYGPSGHKRLSPPSADMPPSEVLHTLEEQRAGGDLVFRYSREVWDDRTWERRESKTRASCIVRQPDEWIIPFDLVTVEECETYLRARTEREAYKEMFPLLKKVVKLKRQEEAEEAPFRSMLAGVLARENGVTVADAEGELDALVRWWKMKTKEHRPLVGDEESQSKAVRMIVAEHRRRLEDRRRPVREEVVKGLRDAYPDAMAIVRPRRGGYLVLVPAEPTKNVYVHEYETTARGVLKARRDWQLVGGREQRWTVAWASERWHEWDLSATHHEHLTGPEKDGLVQAVRDKHRARKPDRYEGPLIAITYTESSGKFHAWMHTGDDDPGEEFGSRIREPDAHGREHEWRRRSTGRVELWDSYYGGHLRVGRYRHGLDLDADEPTPWGWREKKRELLWHSPEREAALEEAIEQYGPLIERRQELEARAEELSGSIREQWVAIERKRQYDEFLREFVDPELWEGHQKSLKAPRWPSGWRVDLLWSICARAVERDFDAEGKTVKQVKHELAVLRDPDQAELPDGVADLVFGEEPITGPWVIEEDSDDDEDARECCERCGEPRDPDEFEEGLLCIYCAQQEFETDDDEDTLDGTFVEEEVPGGGSGECG